MYKRQLLNLTKSIGTVGGLNLDRLSGMNLFKDPSDLSRLPDGSLLGKVFGSIGFAGDILGFVDNLGNLQDDPSLTNVSRSFSSVFAMGSSAFGLVGNEVLGSVTGRISSGYSALGDWFSATDKLNSGDPWGAGYDIVHGTANAAGVVFPPVGMCVTAWDVGYDIGTLIGNSEPMQQYQDEVVAYGARQAAESGTEIGTRYEGVAGFGNFLHDYTLAPISKFFGN